MNKELFSAIKKPSLWQRSNEPFWNDEHISKGMLAMHLNDNLELASRCSDTINKSVKWLSSIIKHTNKILDLGCGPGLYSKRLSSLGYNVTGVDFSKRSIAYAKEHDNKSKYIFQNYLDINFENEFDAIILIYCDYAALTESERKVLLKKIYHALKPNGLFIFDVFTVLSNKNKIITPTWSKYENGGYWSEKSHICLESVFLYENDTVAVNQYIIITEKEVKKYFIWNKVYNLQSLSEEMTINGFNLINKFDDICGKPYTGQSETICLIVSKT